VDAGRHVPARIGIRIEDDHLVTDTELELPSTGAPTSVEEIEALMAGG